MSDNQNSEMPLLEVTSSAQGHHVQTTSQVNTPSATTDRSPADATRSQMDGKLPMELTLKVQEQMARLTLLKEAEDSLIMSILSLDELLEFKADVEDTFNMFLKEHTYFEKVWPSAYLEHDYFRSNVFLEAQRVYASLRQNIAKARALWPAQIYC